MKPFVSKLDELTKKVKMRKAERFMLNKLLALWEIPFVIVTVKVNFAVAADSKNLWKDSWSYKHIRFGSYLEVFFTGRRRGQGLLLKLWGGNGDLYTRVLREQEKK